MYSDDALTGLRAPQQARSRMTLQKLLTAAEDELAAVGADGVTMTGVAGRAGVSVGTVYRRFDGKDELLHAVKARLLGRLVDSLTDRFGAAHGDLGAVVDVFAGAVADWADRTGRYLPELIGLRPAPSPEEDRSGGLVTLARLFVAAAEPYRDRVRHPDPDAALTFAARTITQSAVHRCMTIGFAPDGLTWAGWRTEVAHMMLAYLTSSVTSSVSSSGA